MVGAVGAYDWNGGVLKETRQGKVVPLKSSYADEFPEELKNHGAYLGELQPPALRSEGPELDDKAWTKSSVVVFFCATEETLDRLWQPCS